MQILALSSDRLRAAIEPLEEQETQYGSLQSQKKLRPLAFGPYWDGFIACVLMYVALAVPVEVAFLDVRTFSGNWWLSRVLDLVRALQHVTKPVIWGIAWFCEA